MAVNNRGNGNGGPLSPVRPKEASSTATAVAARPKATAAPSTSTTPKGAAFSDTFETDPGAPRGFGDAHDALTHSGVKSTGLRQMVNVLSTTRRRLLDDIAALSPERQALIEELLSSEFSADGGVAATGKSKAFRAKMNALRRREIALRRRQRLLGAGRSQDPYSRQEVEEFGRDLAKSSHSSTETTLAKLRHGANDNGPLRVVVDEGQRTRHTLDALTEVLPQRTTTAFVVDLLSGGRHATEADADTNTSGVDVVERYRRRAEMLRGIA